MTELREWLQEQDMKHTRGDPYHPMTQGKIERYHRSMKNVVKLGNYYFPWELENAIAEWVAHYNSESSHSLGRGRSTLWYKVDTSRHFRRFEIGQRFLQQNSSSLNLCATNFILGLHMCK